MQDYARHVGAFGAKWPMASASVFAKATPDKS